MASITTTSLPINPPAFALHPPEVSKYFPDAMEVTELQGGSVNRCLQVKTPTGSFVIRLGKANIENYGFDRDRELHFYRQVEHLGLAPPLRNSDLSKNILIMDFINGQTIDKSSIRQEGMIPKITTFLRTLHQIKCTEKQEPVILFYIRTQLAKLKALNFLPADWENKAEQIIKETTFPNSLALCHNDIAGNLLLEHDRLWAVDLECAGWNDPLFDLTPLCIWFEFSREEKQTLLTSYFGELKQEKELDQAIRMTFLFSALWSQLEVAYGNDSYLPQATDLFAKALTLPGKE